MCIVKTAIHCLIVLMNATFKQFYYLLKKSQNYDIGPYRSHCFLLINIGVLSLFINNIIDILIKIKRQCIFCTFLLS